MLTRLPWARRSLLALMIFLLLALPNTLWTSATAAAELCDGRDNDQDGTVDNSCPGRCADPRALSGEQTLADPAWSADLGRDRSLVWDGRGFAAVWVETQGYDTRVVFRRFDPSGSPLGQPLPLSDLVPIDANAAIAWSGSGYGVVWSAEDFGLPELFFAALDDSGQITAGPLKVSTPGEDAQRPSIAWDQDVWIVAWAWYNSRVHFRRLSADGALLGSEVCVTCDTASGAGDISLAPGGGQIGVAYSDSHGGVRFVRTDRQGQALGPPTDLTLQTGAGQPSLVFTGGHYGLAWYDRRDGDDGIFFNRLALDGSTLDTDRRLNGADAYAGTPSLAWTGQEFLVAWGGGNGPDYSILFARLDDQGQPLGSPLYIPAGTGPYSRPSLVWTGSRPTWIRDEDALASPRNILLRRLSCCLDADGDGTSFCDGDQDDGDADSGPDASELCDGRDNDYDGTVDEGCDTSCQAAPLTGEESVGEQQPTRPAVASRGAGAGDYVVRGDATRPGWQLVVDRGPPWQTSAVEEDTAESRDPAASWSGRRLLTVFEDLRSTSARLRLSEFDADGSATVADRDLTDGAAAGARAALGWGGRRTGLVFLNGSPRRAAWTLLAPGGARLLRDIPLGNEEQAAAPEAAISPAWGGGLALAWLSPTGSDQAVWIQLVDEEGGARSTAVEIGTAAPGRRALALSRSRQGYLLAWIETSAGGGEVIMAAAVDGDLALLAAPHPVTAEGGSPDGIAAAFTGSETVLVFRDARDGGRYRPFRLRLDAEGATLGPTTPLGSDRDVGPPAAAWTGSGLRVSWTLPAGTDRQTVRTAVVDCVAAGVASRVRRLRWKDKLTLNWDPVEAAVYDLISGDLARLVLDGDFSAAVDHCEADDLPTTEFTVADLALPRFYLVRAVVAGSAGSWNPDAPGTADRDPSIANAAAGCP